MKQAATALSILLLCTAATCCVLGQTTNPDDQELIKELELYNVDRMHGLTFEIYVCKLLKHRGYATKNMRASNDFGTDIIATKGNDKISIQVKRSKNRIDRKAISDAVAGMKFYKCNKSMVVTNNRFTDSAKKFAKKTECTLIGRAELAKWIASYKQKSKASQNPKDTSPQK